MNSLYRRISDAHNGWLKSVPIFLMHLVPLGAFWSGVHRFDILLAVGLYYARMFFISAGFHRYFAHRGYQLGRAMQFLMAFGATTAAQRGPLWWAGHHRHHHAFSDTPKDIHSPLRGFWWSHMGWIVSGKYRAPRLELIKDFARYPELRWLDKHFLIPPALLGIACFLIGGWSALFIGFFLSTVVLYHGTFVINSLAHVFGRRRYVTRDTSRNSLILALITCGEGWHNNHHYYCSTANQGFFWWEIDLSYYVLKLMSWFGLATDLRTPPSRLLSEYRVKDAQFDIGMLQAQWANAHRYIITTQKQTAAYYEKKKRLMKDYWASAKRTAEDIAARAAATQETLNQTT